MQTSDNKTEFDLQEAFSKFTEASSKLQGKYEELLRETEILRGELRKKDAELKRSEKLSMLGETAAALAHEVRNPLGAMKLFISVLRQDLADRPESLELVDQIDASVMSLDNVVSNILHFSRDRKLPLSPVNLNSVIQEQAALLRSTTTADLEVDLQAEPFLNGNADGLRQILHNLIINALQATKNQGKIEVSTRQLESGDLQLKVKDNGPGISAELFERIFEPFVTGRNEGTGLGLAIVRQIVAQHGGSISAQNDDGAEFTVVLPRNLAA